ncbi:MAG: hypothetical protein ACP6KW_12080 [Candidatus Thorarchaeota archaeon]
MEIYEIAQLFIGSGSIVAAGAVAAYSRRRAAGVADPELRKAFRPLLLFAVALTVFGVGSIVTFLELWTNVPWFADFYYVYYMFIIAETLILSVVASMIMKQYSFPIVMFLMGLVSGYLLVQAGFLVIRYRVSSTAQFYFAFSSIVGLILLGAVALLFAYIAYDTRRSTSISLAYGMVTQIVALPLLNQVQSMFQFWLSFSFVVIALMGPAMIAFAFLRPTQNVSLELLGYGMSFASPVLIFSGIFITGTPPTPEIILIAGIGALGIVMASGTASYLYGRWRETRQAPTGLLLVVFATLAVGHMVGMLGGIGILPSVESLYTEFVMTSFALTLLGVIAIMAAGYRSASLFPFLILLPLLAFFLQRYPDNLAQVFSQYMLWVAPLMAIFALPIVLFGRVAIRIKKSGERGAGRPGGIALALLFYITFRSSFMVPGVGGLHVGHAITAVSFVIFWLAITGRLDPKK